MFWRFLCWGTDWNLCDTAFYLRSKSGQYQHGWITLSWWIQVLLTTIPIEELELSDLEKWFIFVGSIYVGGCKCRCAYQRDIGQASALCQIASFLSYWDSRPSETTLQQRICIPHSLCYSWTRPSSKTRTKPVLIMVKINAALDLNQEPSFQ